MLPRLSFEEQVVAAAREQGVTRITLHASGELPWSSWRERKNAGASGPNLDDAEAAVLIAGRLGLRGARMRLLDLFCGAGGAAEGYRRAGFDEIVGVDIKPQPHYPFEFAQVDAVELMDMLLNGIGIGQFWLQDFDAIHASPPCQGYSRLRHLPWLAGKTWPMLIDPMRARLSRSGLPYVIENVMDAPLLDPIFLCGQMFALPLYRHRKFETSFELLQPGHSKHTVVIGHGRMVNDRAKGTLNAGSSKGSWGAQTIVTVAGGQYRKADGERAMGIDWMTKDELSEAIPPAYTEFLGRQLLAQIADAGGSQTRGPRGRSAQPDGGNPHLDPEIGDPS